MKTITTDGNTACAMGSYATNEMACIYPITPSTPMAEVCDEWSGAGKENIWGQPVKVVEMQSEGGAAGALHGALLGGVLTTTFTASQGLLLMIPNMYKIAGELLPTVFNVAARTLATHALSIFGDHSDVMACRQTGFSMICGESVQQAHDFSIISMMTSLKSSLPVLHFFDGFRTSHQIDKICILEKEEISKLIPNDKVEEFKARALNPNNPKQYGTAQNPDVFFQNREASEKYFQAVGQFFTESCDEFAKLTGRHYSAFQYYGSPDASQVIVAMGSSVETLVQVVNDFNATHKEQVGIISVHLYRPFYAEEFFKSLPLGTKTITVLDRTKEGGSVGEPLYADICTATQEFGKKFRILGGRYGLGGKDFTPACALAVIQNGFKKQQNHFTVGINDDLLNNNLLLPKYSVPSQDTQCMFYGLGSDGTVSANKNSIKIIGDYTNLFAQGYFEYDSKKSGSVTISHLRFGNSPIRAPYNIEMADFIACHNPRFIGKYDFLPKLKDKGTLLLNCSWNANELANHLPANFKKALVEKQIVFYVINAEDIALQLGLKGKINTIMQSAFFKLANLMPYPNAEQAMKEAAQKSYGKAGEQVVAQNYKAIELGASNLIKVNIPKDWSTSTNNIKTEYEVDKNDFAKNIMQPIQELRGNELPTSIFNPDGHIPTDTTKYEKRGVAVNIPCWKKENCIQCNFCSLVCPHGAIKPVLINKNTKKPALFDTIPAQNSSDYEFRLQISPLDCTGCGSCANVCPAKQKALIMEDGEQQTITQAPLYQYATTFENDETTFAPNTLKGSQFLPCHFQFSGACAGCGETPYIKLVTQMFGNKMVIANATGCTSIYGGSFPSCPYTKDKNGRGPAWANSLFEDNAEFGLGMRLAINSKQAQLSKELTNLAKQLPSLQNCVNSYLQNQQNLNTSRETTQTLLNTLQKVKSSCDSKNKALIDTILKKSADLDAKSVWIFGGDGWAYDIGYGGLDHVLASGENVNILVLDSQVYSNTGGQASKATPAGAVAKFAEYGKQNSKKNLGLMALAYPEVYVAQIALGANMAQAFNAIKEAAEYPGVSIIIAYSTCINHGIDMSQGMLTMKEAVQSGFWHLFRYNPNTKKLVLDSPAPTLDYIEFARKQRRFANLIKKNPIQAEALLQKSKQDNELLYTKLLKLSQN